MTTTPPLPESWSVRAVADLVTSVDYGHTSKAQPGGSGPPYLRITDIQNRSVDWSSVPGCSISSEEIERYRLVEGDLVFARTGATTGKSFLIRSCPADAVFSSYLIRLRPAEATSPAYLAFFFQSADYWRQIAEQATGTAQPGVNAKRLRQVALPIAPLPEQRRIVAAIESYFTRLDDAVASLERAQRNLERYRASVLKSAVEGRLVPTEAELARAEGRNFEPASILLERLLAERRRRWEEAELAKMAAKGKTSKNDKWKAKYKEPVAPDTSQLPVLPPGWSWASVDQIGSISGGLTQNSKRSQLPLQLPFLRVANVYANELRLDEIKTIGVTEAELLRVRLEAGDLLVVEGNGSIEQIGRVAVWDGSIDPCLHQNHLIKVRFSPLELARWTLSWLLAPSGRMAIENVASSTSGLHTLSLSKIARLPVPVPPLAEQARIGDEVERLTTIAKAATADVEASSRRCLRLRQAVLKWAFEGKLVDQDPADEPAATLLDRIRDGREVAPEKKPTSRRRTKTRSTKA